MEQVRAMASCQNCGEMVTKNYTRVFGDNDNTLEGCVYCRSLEERTGIEDENPYLLDPPQITSL